MSWTPSSIEYAVFLGAFCPRVARPVVAIAAMIADRDAARSSRARPRPTSASRRRPRAIAWRLRPRSCRRARCAGSPGRSSRTSRGSRCPRTRAFNTIYPSGTTGVPKGIDQAHGMRWLHVRRAAALFG